MYATTPSKMVPVLNLLFMITFDGLLPLFLYLIRFFPLFKVHKICRKSVIQFSYTNKITLYVVGLLKVNKTMSDTMETLGQKKY